MSTTWLEILLYIATTAVGIWLNYMLVTSRVKRKVDEQTAVYKDRVDRLTWEVNRYEQKVEIMGRDIGVLGRQVAAISGKANGTTYRQGD